MSDEVITVVPETHVMETSGPGGIPAQEGFSGKVSDFAADIAKIAAEQGVQVPAEQPPVPQPVMEPVQPPPPAPQGQEPEAPATQEQAQMEVPVKFQNPDGSVNEPALNKSLSHVEAALAKFEAKEKELRRKQSEASKQGLPAASAQGEPTSFEAQIEADIKTNGVGKTLANLFQAAKEAAYSQAKSDMERIAGDFEANKRQRELEAIAASDPWVLSEDGIKSLGEIREAKPWINQSPTPWTEAYRQHLADEALNQRIGKPKVAPTSPKALTPPQGAVRASAPIAQTVKIDLNDTVAINKHLDALTPAQQDEFWRKNGLKFIVKRPY